MEHMNRKYPKEDAMLRPHKESTLEKNQAKRIARRVELEKQFSKVKKDKF
jgi:IS5 family transposase